MTPELRRADAEGLPCYLETFQPRNVPLYLKHGFQIMAEEVEPASCFTRLVLSAQASVKHLFVKRVSVRSRLEISIYYFRPQIMQAFIFSSSFIAGSP
jgi:hypothetical protein